jgi:hypothetical protein
VAKIPESISTTLSTGEIDPGIRGTYVHRLLECLDFENLPRGYSLVGQLLRDSPLTESEKNTLSGEMKYVIHGLVKKGFDQRVKKYKIIQREVSLVYRGEIKITGKADLIGINNNLIDIFDFKTDSVDEKGISEKMEHYALQMGAYITALNQDGKKVGSVYLYFTKSNLLKKYESLEDLSSRFFYLVQQLAEVYRLWSSESGYRGYLFRVKDRFFEKILDYLPAVLPCIGCSFHKLCPISPKG